MNPKRKPRVIPRTSKFLYTFAALIGLAAVLALLYPRISDAWNRYVSGQQIKTYEATISSQDAEKTEEEIRRAREYNGRLFAAGNNHIAEYTEKSSNNSGSGQFSQEVVNPDEEYGSLLSFSDDGLMGYIDIPRINVSLPIRHYTTSEVLAEGTGHLYGSSLPIGGPSTHSVITGHSALMKSRLFTDLPKLSVGDRFSVNVAGLKLNYEVDQVTTVLPSELQDLDIQEGKDYVTLITCTPYAINTHRLLVRGVRIADDAPDVEKSLSEQAEAVAEMPIVMFAISGLMILFTAAIVIRIWRPNS